MRSWTYCLVALAALAGAAGVIEAAMVAHATTDPLIQTSANFLQLNAAAVIAIAAVAQAAPFRRRAFLVAGSILLGGSALFCGDLTARALSTQRLFPFAAPIGGTSMILGWIATALAGLAVGFGGRSRDS